ncbi:MAG: hypothetical protein ABR556_13990, partial [Pyrinomonadaceae bacterium]
MIIKAWNTAVPTDVRWRLCPTDHLPISFEWGYAPSEGIAPKAELIARKVTDLPHIRRQSRA